MKNVLENQEYHFSKSEYKLPSIFAWAKDLVVFVKYRPHGVVKDYPALPIFRKPVEFSLIANKKIYRLLSTDPGYAVSALGEVISIHSWKILEQGKRETHRGSYPTVVISDTYRGARIGKVVHRLVGIAWVPNDDYYTNNIVNHIDENKQNTNYLNLEWISNSRNIAYSANKMYNRWLVKTPDGITHKFPSLTAASKFMHVPPIRVSSNTLPAEIVGGDDTVYVLADATTFTGWEILRSGYESEDTNMYYAKNLKTGEIVKHHKMYELAKMLGIPKATVQSRYSYRKNREANGWVFSVDGITWPKVESYKSTRKVIGIFKDGKCIDQGSARYIGNRLRRDKNTITKHIGKNLDGYDIQLL